MKKRVSYLLLLLFLNFSAIGLSQNYPISTGGTILTCSGLFTDAGGAGGNYTANESYVITFCSNSGSEISLDFSAYGFQVETNYDFLNIYDGTTTLGTPIYQSQPSGGNNNPGIITSTTGCLTIEWSSDGSVQYQGWAADIICPTCSDGIQNGTETAIDCGGASCPPCDNCFDGIQNGTETGIDCGGTCEPCHCSDGVQSGDETGIDCGGSCAQACPIPCNIELEYEIAPVTGGCCDYTFNMFDSWGDGWNGGSVNINVNGVNQGPFTIASGSSNTATINVCHGDAIDLDYTNSGSFPSEISFELLDADGTVIYSGGGTGTGNNLYVGAASCTTPGVLDCNGGDIILTAEGEGQNVLVIDNNFDAGGAGTGWNSNITADFTNPCDPSFDGGTYMWMGNSAAHPRIIETVPLDVSCGGTLCFWLDFATQGNASPCEGIDEPDEGVFLEYSTDNGATWTTIEYFGPAGVGNSTDNGGTDPQMTSWNQYCFDIPPGAETANTLFHWAQTGSSGNGNDHWGLDNVTISSLVDCTPYVYDYTHIPGGDDNPVQNETISSTTTYTVIYTNGSDACTTSVVVPVPVGTTADAGPDITICQGGGPVTIGADPITPDDGATYSWNNAAGGGTIDLNPAGGTENGQVNVNPATTTEYIVTVTYNGCDATDTMNVNIVPNPNVNDLPDVNRCDFYTFQNITGTNLSGNQAFYTGPGGTGTQYNPGDVITTSGTFYIYDESGTTPNCFDEETFTVTINVTPTVNDIADLSACDTYTLPAITGTNLTGNESYWSASGGTGTQFNPGDVITASTGLFIYDQTGTTPNCTDQEFFNITINTSVNAGADNTDDICSNSGFYDVNGLLSGADPGGNWAETSGSGQFNSGTELLNTVGLDGAYTFTYTVVGTAPCPNDVANFTVNIDGTPPTINCPGALTAVCDITEQPPYATFADFTAAGGSASDATSGIDATSFTLLSEVSDGNSCPEVITRTYQIADNCGNTNTCTQTITIDDNIAPTGTAPAAVTVECAGDVPAVDITAITDEADNCGVPTVTHVSDVSDGNTCPEVITRTYRITDACGNTTDVTQTITIDDTTDPTASNPPNINITNADPIPGQDPTVVTDEADNCDPTPTVAFVSDVSDGGSCPETITRTYSVTDDCGNQITVTQLIIIGDAIMPTASNPPAINVECIADVPAPDPTVVTDEADNSGPPVVAFDNDASDGNSCPETITRTYSVTDDCGNVIYVTQSIIIDDVTPPTGTAPADYTVECAADVVAADPTEIVDEADNCTAAPTVTHVSDVSDGNTCPEVITRTYRITDDCGNSTDVVQTITIDDTTPPTGTAPADYTVECAADVVAADPTEIVDEADNCDPAPVVTHVSDVSDGNTCPEVITRTYRITDACGNTTDVTQTITIDDTTDPTASNPADINVPGGGAVPGPDPTVVTDEADNCTAAPTVVHVSDVSDGNNCPETITRTYSVTDDCGNQITVTQLIIIGDAIMPTASDPADINVECIADVPAADPAVVTDEADNGGPPTVALDSEVSDGNTCPETITRTYSVTDNCGNVIYVSHDIIVNDVTPPTGTAPADYTVECAADVTPADPTEIVDEADNCTAAPTVTHVSDVSDGNTCPEVITRTYRITDDCGNTTDVTQTITIDDTTPPTGTAPADYTVECAADVVAADPTEIVDEADNCDPAPVVTHVSDVSDGNTCPEVITRTYRITDACGNTTDVTQTITIDDTTDPTASNPADINQAGGVAPAPDVTVVTDEADNCTAAPTVAFVSDVSDGNNCPETITRTYSVTDDCGNQITVTQLIIIGDPFPPTGTAPADYTVECAADVTPADPTEIVDEADNNGVPTVTHLSDVSDGNTCPEVITRTYRITDPCGNITDVVQTITIDDTTPPTGTAPADYTVECAADVTPADPTEIVDEADNCTAAPTVTHVSDVSDGNTCPEVITRTYRITDDCGNTTDVTQTITIDDTTPPTGTAPADYTVECAADVVAADPTEIVDEADNCDPAPVVTHVSDLSDGNTCPEVITRTYRITDACGNTTDVTQTITIDDTTDPTASNPADINQAGGVAPAPDVTVVTDEADNCTAAPTVAFVSDVSDGNNCPETITRTYSVTDDCGNQITVTQLIIIGDPFPPTGTAPADYTVECAADVTPADPTEIVDEADNNGVPTVTHLSDVSDGNTCPEVITRTYRITDPCGNITDVVQTITINDITPPTGTAPADYTVECAADVTPADPTEIVDEADNCDPAPVVTHVSDVSDGNTCPEVITRTYRITDACGNTTDVTQTITIDDTTPPTGTAPADYTVECAADVVAADPTEIVDEADNCDPAPVVTHVSDVSDGNTCPEVITRTYRITDACGNTTDVTQTITIDDTTDPTASNPADINITTLDPIPAPDPTVVTDEADNCTAAPIVAFVSEVSDGNPCPETITRTYSVTDDCGNQITVTQLVIITDPEPPTGTAPADITVECIGDVPAADPTLIIDEADNNGVPTVTHLSDVSDGNTCPEVITRTYRITDPCGNFTDVVQLITINDITPPTGTAPADYTVECAADVVAADPTEIVDEADNCTAAPTVTHVSDVSDGNTCPEVITRTYRITDDCGNTTDVVQTITIDDTTPPTGTAPADYTVECAADVVAADPTEIVDEADNCDPAPVVTHVSDVSDGNTCPEVITRTYRITDACGNTTDVTQTITIDDTTDPTASNPADINITTLDPIPAPDPTVVTDEADNCTAAPIVAFVSEVSDGNPCPETITRTYSVTDDCGNQITVTQLVIITDPEPPTGTAPADYTVECAADVTPADPTEIVDEADNNGVQSVTHVSDVSDGNTCPEVITRTYRITDVCGNFTDVVQTITIDDTTPPTASNPAGVTVECIGDVPAVDITVVTDEADNCTAVPTVTHVSDVSDGNSCPEIITRTYRITDDCGNTTDVTQTITVDDTTPPTASNPVAVSVECITDVPAIDITVVTDEADNCTAAPLVAHVSDVSDGNTCPEVITRTYSVTDDCGNSINVTQTITVNDITNPTASNPAPIVVDCPSNIPPPNPTVVTDEADNCTAAPIVAFVSDVSDNNSCNNETITRTYSVTDDCGNSINVTQIITVSAVTPTVNAGTDVVVCDGEMVTLNATESHGNLSWDNGITDGVAFTPSVGTTTYTATAEICGGFCFSTDQVNVTVNPLPDVIFTGDPLIGCEPLPVTFTNLTANAMDCQWDFGDGNTSNDCGSVTNIYQNAGTYDVSLTVTSTDGCVNSVTYSDYVDVAPYPVAAFTFTPDVLDLSSTYVEFTNESVNADTYTWTFGDLTASSNEENPTHTYPEVGGEQYVITLIAESDAGCSDTARAIIHVDDVIIFYVPNVFTPDGDDFNENFLPVFTSGYDIYDYHLTIFNRWGEIIFESYNADYGWDGTYGSQGLVEDGVYVWQIEFGETMSDKKHKVRGHVTVLK